MNRHHQAGFISLPIMMIFIIVATFMIAMHAARTSAMFQKNYQNGLNIQAQWLNVSAVEQAINDFGQSNINETPNKSYEIDVSYSYIGTDPLEEIEPTDEIEEWTNYRTITIEYGYEILKDKQFPDPDILQGKANKIVMVETYAQVPYKGRIKQHKKKWLCWQGSNQVWKKLPLVDE